MDDMSRAVFVTILGTAHAFRHGHVTRRRLPFFHRIITGLILRRGLADKEPRGRRRPRPQERALEPRKLVWSAKSGTSPPGSCSAPSCWSRRRQNPRFRAPIASTRSRSREDHAPSVPRCQAANLRTQFFPTYPMRCSSAVVRQLRYAHRADPLSSG